jgi:hypothetical protein
MPTISPKALMTAAVASREFSGSACVAGPSDQTQGSLMLTTATAFSGVVICGPLWADQIQLWPSAVSPTTCPRLLMARAARLNA